MAKALKGTDPKAAKQSKPKILIFGKPGVGKTWASIDFPSVYYIDTEGGANLDHYTDKLKRSGAMYFGPEHGSLDFASVIEEITTLATVKHPYRTLVIDSFSKLFNTCINGTAERMKRDKEKLGFGNEKKEAVAFTRRLGMWLDKLDMNVILICHQKDQWMNGECVGQTFDGWEKMEYDLHLVLQIIKQGQTRRAKITKSRLKEFPDGETFEWSYAEFAKRYGQDVIESAAVPFAPATPDQVNKLTVLIEACRTPIELTDKWKEKAGVDSYSEMNTDDIQKCIDYLTSKLPKAA